MGQCGDNYSCEILKSGKRFIFSHVTFNLILFMHFKIKLGFSFLTLSVFHDSHLLGLTVAYLKKHINNRLLAFYIIGFNNTYNNLIFKHVLSFCPHVLLILAELL